MGNAYTPALLTSIGEPASDIQDGCLPFQTLVVWIGYQIASCWCSTACRKRVRPILHPTCCLHVCLIQRNVNRSTGSHTILLGNLLVQYCSKLRMIVVLMPCDYQNFKMKTSRARKDRLQRGHALQLFWDCIQRSIQLSNITAATKM